MKRIIIISFLLLACFGEIGAKNIKDNKGTNINKLFDSKNSTYIIRYEHQFTDTLFVPSGCEIDFEGGSMSGPIVFDHTKLSGDVKLQGSSLLGSLRNTSFNASWLCYKDGVNDDAANINNILEICDKVFFPKGNYRLVSMFNTKGKLPKSYEAEIRTHIGICKSNVLLVGEEGTVFISDKPICAISVFSQPYQINESIRGIKICNITFDILNDGKSFYEFAHSIRLVGVNGLFIDGCTFNRFFGDAISFSHYGDTPKTGERTRNQNVMIINNVFWGGEHHNNRNGISIVSGKNVLIKKNIFKSISRQDMPGAIDIEPNNSAYTIENIRIIGNQIEECYGKMGAIGIQFLYEGTTGKRIKILSNQIQSSTYGLGIAVVKGSETSDIIIKNNVVLADTQPYRFYWDGSSRDWNISGNKFEMKCNQNIPGAIRVKNLVINNKKKD